MLLRPTISTHKISQLQGTSFVALGFEHLVRWKYLHLEGTCAPGHQLANFTSLGAQKILSWLGEKVQIFKSIITLQNQRVFFLPPPPPRHILCHFRQVLSNDPSMCSSYCAYHPQTVHIQGMTFPDCLNVGGHLPPSCV